MLVVDLVAGAFDDDDACMRIRPQETCFVLGGESAPQDRVGPKDDGRTGERRLESEEARGSETSG